MTNLVLSVWLVVLTNPIGVVNTNLVLETMGPQRVSVPLGPLLSRATVTNIARGEVTNGLLKLTNMSFSLTGQMTAPLTGVVRVNP